MRLAACVAVPDEIRGEEVKAYVVLQPGIDRAEITPQVLADFCSERLAYFKVPRYWAFAAALSPFSNSGRPSSVDGSFYSYEFDTYDDTSNPEVAEYRAAMTKYAPVAGKSEFYQWGFADVMTVYNIAKKIGGANLTQKSYLNALTNIEGMNVFMGGPLSKKSAAKASPQIIQPQIRIVQYKGGKVSPVSQGFFNPLG